MPDCLWFNWGKFFSLENETLQEEAKHMNIWTEMTVWSQHRGRIRTREQPINDISNDIPNDNARQ